MALAAGRLNQRIVLQQNAETQDSIGAAVASWSTFTTLWAQARALTGAERHVADQQDAKVDHEFVVRHTAGITPGMRISWDSRTFEIVAAFDPNGIKERLVILAREDV